MALHGRHFAKVNTSSWSFDSSDMLETSHIQHIVRCTEFWDSTNRQLFVACRTSLLIFLSYAITLMENHFPRVCDYHTYHLYIKIITPMLVLPSLAHLSLAQFFSKFSSLILPSLNHSIIYYHAYVCILTITRGACSLLLSQDIQRISLAETKETNEDQRRLWT